MMIVRKFLSVPTKVYQLRCQGVAKISLKDKQSVSHVLSLSNCLNVPEHSRNFLSVSAITEKGAKVVCDDLCELRCPDKVSFSFERKKMAWMLSMLSITVHHIWSLLLKRTSIFGIAVWCILTKRMC